MILYPQPLKRGDKVAICSPAGPIAPEKVEGAAAVLRAHGWEVEIMPHTFGRNGYYSGTAEERYDDLSRALLDPTVRAVICSRGGYGVVHILDKLSRLPLADDPKWVAGFSDISALHALMVAPAQQAQDKAHDRHAKGKHQKENKGQDGNDDSE